MPSVLGSSRPGPRKVDTYDRWVRFESDPSSSRRARWCRPVPRLQGLVIADSEIEPAVRSRQRATTRLTLSAVVH